ncbi:unnamed protein product [Vitrella brassicaformis CCMP3155]|uniref:Uncharacterized protein n=2 Tax=Vitrella brassicaformis TaxID=1169539 RepID=A0A0G4GBF9_VITBC|nr:unnamed protein product [Vitrella brassicaformis CCMP3155]|eukprot:CEM26457.1 unnamed protein product [Vitrella brassicaformis CCMP3155]
MEEALREGLREKEERIQELETQVWHQKEVDVIYHNLCRRYMEYEVAILTKNDRIRKLEADNAALQQEVDEVRRLHAARQTMAHPVQPPTRATVPVPAAIVDKVTAGAVPRSLTDTMGDDKASDGLGRSDGTFAGSVSTMADDYEVLQKKYQELEQRYLAVQHRLNMHEAAVMRFQMGPPSFYQQPKMPMPPFPPHGFPMAPEPKAAPLQADASSDGSSPSSPASPTRLSPFMRLMPRSPSHARSPTHAAKEGSDGEVLQRTESESSSESVIHHKAFCGLPGFMSARPRDDRASVRKKKSDEQQQAFDNKEDAVDLTDGKTTDDKQEPEAEEARPIDTAPPPPSETLPRDSKPASPPIAAAAASVNPSFSSNVPPLSLPRPPAQYGPYVRELAPQPWMADGSQSERQFDRTMCGSTRPLWEGPWPPPYPVGFPSTTDEAQKGEAAAREKKASS